MILVQTCVSIVLAILFQKLWSFCSSCFVLGFFSGILGTPRNQGCTELLFALVGKKITLERKGEKEKKENGQEGGERKLGK